MDFYITLQKIKPMVLSSELIALAIIALVALLILSSSIMIVPQTQNYLIERLGRYNRKLEAGMHLIMPLYERVAHRVNILERQLPSQKIPTITLDNVQIEITLAILYRIVDAAKAMYRVQNIDKAIETIVIGTVRSVIGKTDLDGVQSNRAHIIEEISRELTAASEEWGILLTRVEIIDVEVDAQTRSAMQLQLNAERTRRAVVREAEGKREAMQLNADGQLYAARQEAEGKKLLADAQAYAVSTVAKAINDGGEAAINFEIRKVQADAIKAIGNGANTKVLLLPSDILDGLTGTLHKLMGK